MYGRRSMSEVVRAATTIAEMMCNLCFIAICALLALSCRLIMHIERECILWGIGLGAFCMTWPIVYSYRLYAFRGNPELPVHFLLNAFVIVYAVCMAELFLTGNAWMLLSLLIPVVGRPARAWAEELRIDLLEEMSFQTKFYTTWKKLCLTEPPLVKRYGGIIEEACREYTLPPLFLTRLMLLENIEQGMWYCKVPSHLIPKLFPALCWRLNLSVGVSLIKPKTAAACFGGSPKETVRMLCDPRENISILARYIRQLLDEYPGAGRYLSQSLIERSRFSAIEYDTLDETAQLCRYIVSRYSVGTNCTRWDYADIYMDVLLKSDAEKLPEEKQKSSQ